jgi:hypothetical protein
MLLHLILANYLTPEAILHLNIQSVQTQLLRRVELSMDIDLVSQLLEQLLCRSSSLTLIDFPANPIFTFLFLYYIVLCQMWIPSLNLCGSNHHFIKITI